MAKTSRDTSSARWPWLVGASALLLAVAWCAWDDEPPVVVPEPLAEPAVVVPEPPPPPPIALSPEPEPADAATELEVPPADAGLVFREPNVEDYMNRWRAALAPLFEEKAVRYTRPTLIPATPRPDAGVADAGVCERQEQRLSLLMNQRFDVVVVVDTSGSMNASLEMLARWLAELELRIRERHSDTQLLVLADQRRLNRKRADGGVNAMVQSNDALEVLLNFQWVWVRLLRPAAELRLVVITDDEADPYGPGAERFLSELTDRLEGRSFSFHVMGGFDTPPEVVLPPSAPVTPSLCSSGHEIGLAAGLTYQALARQTHGLRASLCHPGSRAALSAALLAVPSSRSCAWALDLARHRVDEVNAIGPDVARNRLTWERAPGLCRGMRWSYVVEGPLVSLCPETCEALRQEGYDALDVTLECR